MALARKRGGDSYTKTRLKDGSSEKTRGRLLYENETKRMALARKRGGDSYTKTGLKDGSSAKTRGRLLYENETKGWL